MAGAFDPAVPPGRSQWTEKVEPRHRGSLQVVNSVPKHAGKERKDRRWLWTRQLDGRSVQALAGDLLQDSPRAGARDSTYEVVPRHNLLLLLRSPPPARPPKRWSRGSAAHFKLSTPFPNTQERNVKIVGGSGPVNWTEGQSRRLLATSSRTRATKSSRDITCCFFFAPRRRTATVPAAASFSPTTAM